ncbi:replication initiation protein [Escherichia coli]
MSDLIAYKSNALIEASYKYFAGTALPAGSVSASKSGEDSPSPDEQKTMTITAAEFHDAFPDMGRQHAEARLKEAIDRLWDRSVIIKNGKNEKSSAGCSTGRSISKVRRRLISPSPMPSCRGPKADLRG